MCHPGQYHRRATVFRQYFHNQLQEQIRRFAGLHLCWKVLLNTIFFRATKRRVGNNDIQLFIPGGKRFVQGVVVTNLYRYFNAVQQHIGGRQQVRKLFFLNTVDLLLQRLMIGDALHVFVLY